MQCKWSRSIADEKAESAALVVSLISEVQKMVPVPTETLMTGFVDLWAKADPRVIQLHSALLNSDFALPCQ